MQYPAEILPCKSYKRIECQLEGYKLSRSIFEVKPGIPIKSDSGFISKEYVVDQGSQLLDYSTNLLGIFKPEHHQIRLSRERAQYCEPNTEVENPVENTDYELIPDATYFEIPITADFYDEVELNCQGEVRRMQICIKHTPNLGNFWHFSLDWLKPPDFEVLLSRKDYKRKRSRWERQMFDAIKNYIRLIANYPPENGNNELPKEEYFSEST